MTYGRRSMRSDDTLYRGVITTTYPADAEHPEPRTSVVIYGPYRGRRQASAALTVERKNKVCWYGVDPANIDGHVEVCEPTWRPLDEG